MSNIEHRFNTERSNDLYLQGDAARVRGGSRTAFFDLTIISMFAITALSNSAYALIAPFLPFEFEKKSIDQSLVGYIFSIYSVAVIISSPLIGKMIKNRGRR